MQRYVDATLSTLIDIYCQYFLMHCALQLYAFQLQLYSKESSSKLEKYLCKTVNDGIKGHNHGLSIKLAS